MKTKHYYSTNTHTHTHTQVYLVIETTIEIFLAMSNTIFCVLSCEIIEGTNKPWNSQYNDSAHHN